MKIAVLQSNYIPWKGYFDIIHDVDKFVFLDDVQYTSRDWRNRNLILTANGTQWLTVPVVSNNRDARICDMKIVRDKWCEKHIKAIFLNYGKTPFFNKYKQMLEHIYFEMEWDYLFELNRCLINVISRDCLGITTEFADSRDFHVTGSKHERLLSLVKAVGADTYVSGPAARDYIQVGDYASSGIELVWKDYSGYPSYAQRFGNSFVSNVSIIDLLFNVGDDAPYYIWGWRENVIR